MYHRNGGESSALIILYGNYQAVITWDRWEHIPVRREINLSANARFC